MQESDVDYSLIPHSLQLVLEEQQLTLSEALRIHYLTRGLRFTGLHTVTSTYVKVYIHNHGCMICGYAYMQLNRIDAAYRHTTVY